MQKRSRVLDNKMKRIQQNRRGRTDTRDSLSLPLAYIRLACMWVAIVAVDAVTGFRLELVWPFWCIIRSAYESIQKNQQTVASLANPHTATIPKFSVLFLCVTATSDLICYLFIPVRMLIFLATTYVWIHLIWHTHGGFIRTVNTMSNGDRSQSWLIITLSAFVIAFEIFLRVRFSRCDLSMVGSGKESSSSTSLLPNGLSPVLPRSINAFFASHGMGYPIVLVTISVNYFLSEWKMKRKQEDNSNKNEQLYRILVESLPAEYEGPKDYSKDCIEEESYLLDSTSAIVQQPGTPLQQLAITAQLNNGHTSSKKNGFSKGRDQLSKRGKKNGVYLPSNGGLGSTPPIEKKKNQKHRIDDDDNDESDGEDYNWRDCSFDEPKRGGGISMIRFLCDLAAWTFSIFGGIVRSPSNRSLEHQPARQYAELVMNGDDEDNESRMQNNRASSDSLSLVPAKSRSNTMQSTSNRQQHHSNNNNNNNKRSNGGGKQHNKLNNDKQSNGHSRHLGSSAALRDSSRDTSVSNDAEMRNMSREIDILRSEVNSKRNIEEDMKLQISMLESSESRLTQTISHLRMRIDQLDNKCASLEKHRESDKASLEQSEQKYSVLLARKAELEQALIAERKQRNDDTGKKMDLAEHQREKERQLEKEVDRLRAELKTKEDFSTKMEVELNQLKNYKEDNDIDSINMELRMHKEKYQYLEASLASENKLKQELFRAIGTAKASNKILEKRIADLENELRNRAILVPIDPNDDTTNSDQSSPHQHSAMGSPVPSTKTPLSINVNNRTSPFGDKLSPIGSPPHLRNVAAPPDYNMAVTHHKPVTNAFAYRYNQPYSSNGEHMLFDAPPPPTSTCASLTTHELLASGHMGKFGAPSNPATRSN